MLKGVNKQILEVTNTESPYFEKIIFFVRPALHGVSSEKLEHEAKKISTQTSVKPPRQKKSLKRFFAIAGYSILSIGAGIALTFITTTLI
jgi:hypothetical protein